LVEGYGQVASGAGPPRGELLRIAGVEGAREIAFVGPEAPRAARPGLGLLLGLVAAAGLIGGLGGLLLARSSPGEQEALAEISRAAARVAAGDLSSTIELRLAGRADQTLRQFDRMTLELREMRARLAEAERLGAYQEIARRLAHELKNPLSAMQVAIETVRKAHAKQVPGFEEIFEESTRAVLEEVRRLSDSVREFSEFARLPKPVPGALSLSNLVTEVAQLYRPDDVTLDLDAEPALPSVRVDRDQITQTLVNLLQNAFDAAREQNPRGARVQVRVHGLGESVVLDVDDNGPGIPKRERERIFEPYVTGKPKGTGLGLAIVKRIVSDHGARIEVGDSPLGGARMRVVFPGASELPTVPG
jgi:nitrogen fixation/metabolism regulation signal transduction histidine kinase